MGLTPPRCALRGQPAAVQIRSRRICRTGDSAGRVTGSLHPLSPPDTKTPPVGAFWYLAERVGFEPTEGLTLRRFSRPVP